MAPSRRAKGHPKTQAPFTSGVQHWASGGRVKWVDPKNIHLTVRFLGDTDDKLVPKIARLMDEVASPFPAVEASIARLGAFPNLNRPRVIWAGIDGELEPLEKMAHQIELAVRKLRFEKESKGFKPHLTLARVRDPRDVGRLPAEIENYRVQRTPLLLDRLVLFKSTLTPRGPIYDRLHETVLGEERFGE